jgi:hypothetical protein
VDPGRARAAPLAPQPPPTSSSPATASVPDDVGEADWIPDLEPIPWHLKLLAGAVALYLGWRAFQGIEWLVHRF